MKKSGIIGGAAVAVLIVVVILLRPFGEQEHPATVIEVVNQVDAHPRPQADWMSAWVDMRIFGGGQVRTGAESSARLELLEGIVRLSGDSVFTAKKSSTHEGKLVTTVFLEHGRLWAYLTPDQSHEFTVETGRAVAAVRDTRFSVQVTDETTLVSVAEGEATLTAQGQTVTVKAVEQATVEPDRAPSSPEPMSDQEGALWATEGEMPELAPPAIEMEGDVCCAFIIPGAFDPGASPPIGFYKLTLWDAEGETLYSWGPADGGSQPETAHRVPFRRQDFAPGASGLALEELEGRTFHISVDAFSSAPEEAAGHGLECEAQDPEEGIWVVIGEGQVQIENP